MTDHKPECRWEKTTDQECEFRNTHHYCPHAAHACDCRPNDGIDPLWLLLRSFADDFMFAAHHAKCKDFQDASIQLGHGKLLNMDSYVAKIKEILK